MTAPLQPSPIGTPIPEGSPPPEDAPAAVASEREIRPDTDWRRPMLVGAVLFAVLVGGVFGWLALSPLSSAVLANGSVVVRGRPQLVQHLDGGIVRAILVRNGDPVRKGDLLARLDETLLTANLEIYRNRLREASARKARLESERDGLAEVVFDDARGTALRLGDDSVHRDGQRRLFEARRTSRIGQIEQFREKIAQSRNQIVGVQGVIAARREQLTFIERELKGLQELHSHGIAPLTRVLAQERNRVELIGQIAEQTAELARIENAIRETEIGILQVHRQFQESVLAELREVTTQVDDMSQQITATTKQLERVEIRAPVGGIVHELAIHTIGGVIPAGATLMQLISLDEGVELEVNVEAHSVDQIAVGQAAEVRFPAFNRSTTPSLLGVVSRISPTSVVEERSGAAFYRVGVDVSPEEIARLGGARLVPGMPSEVHLSLPARSALSYLLKPVADHWHRALLEK